ncbi:MAG TPA: glucose-6-phosphate isomerase [Candidatus Wallbacteria bacterium]|nr:glucose-6-phosphate isomerase [Candidatus Wallbacteria bacterium]
MTNNRIEIEITNLQNALNLNEIKACQTQVSKYHKALHDKTGAGNDFLGWLDLPSKTEDKFIDEIEALAARIRKEADVFLCVGIGGSYLGAKAVNTAMNEFFNDNFEKGARKNPVIIFAGQNLSADYMNSLFKYLEGKSVYVNVISKSGTTTEPAVAFRVIKKFMEDKYGKDVKNRIIATTDKSRGALKKLADSEGYKTYVIPDDVGGRFSVLTPVGLLPIAVAGHSIKKLVEGARSFENLTGCDDIMKNPAYMYAACRYLLYKKGFTVELLSNFEPALHYVSEWWKQLYGESEGKDKKGIFPASVDFTTDLHSMGQYIQDGERKLFETFLMIEKTTKFDIPTDPANLDGLNFLAGNDLSHANKMAYEGTRLAHLEGGVPNMTITLPELNEYYLGQLIYFYEKAVAISGYMIEVNPFDQPGVESYKKNMFALMKKPGFEAETERLNKVLAAAKIVKI